jgi:HD-like signal output (HDOD) protein
MSVHAAMEDADEIATALLAAIEDGDVKIPPYPAVALKLQKLLARQDFALVELLNVLSSDQSLVAAVLRCANSAFFNRGQVVSLQQAVLRIGADEVGRLALVASLAGEFRAPGSLQSLKQKVWENSIASASICQALAKRRGLHRDDAFVAGLLHDFGWVVGISAVERIIAQRNLTTPRTSEQWSAMLDRLHVRLGVEVATRWNLPKLLQGVMAEHHMAAVASGDHASMVELVQASDAVVALLAAQPHVSAADLATLRRLQPGEAEPLAAALPEIPSLISAFNSDSTAIPVAAPPSMLVQPLTTLPDGYRPLELAVRQVKPRPHGPFTMFGIASQGWAMRGKQPLPVLQLFEAEIATPSQGTLRLWAKTTLCTAQAGTWRIECKLFALSGSVQLGWNELFRATPRT